MQPTQRKRLFSRVDIVVVKHGIILNGVDVVKQYKAIRRLVYVKRKQWATEDEEQDGLDEHCMFVLAIVDGSVRGGMRIIPPWVEQPAAAYTDDDLSNVYELSRLVIHEDYQGKKITHGIFSKTYELLMRKKAEAVICSVVGRSFKIITDAGFPYDEITTSQWGGTAKGKVPVMITVIKIPLRGLLRALWKTNKATWLMYLALYLRGIVMLFMRFRER